MIDNALNVQQQKLKNAFCIPKCQMTQNSVNMISLCFTRLISRYRRSRYTCIKIIIAQFAKKMDGCYGTMLYPTIWTNIVANADRQLIGKNKKEDWQKWEQDEFLTRRTRR